MKTKVLVITISILLAGCQQDAGEAPTAAQDASHRLEPSTLGYFSYGEPVPRPAPKHLVPEPYDRSKHGDLLPNSMASQDLTERPDIKLPSLARHRANSRRGLQTAAFDDDEQRGYWINTIAPGIQAGNDIQNSFTLPGNLDKDVYLFAPTHKPSGPACLEGTTVHMREVGGNTLHFHGFWDWCSHANPDSTGWDVTIPLNTDFVNTYGVYYDNEPVYFMAIYATNAGNPSAGSWEGIIYNAVEGEWEDWAESEATIPGTPSNGDGNLGWTMWESANTEKLASCLIVPAIRSVGVEVYETDGTWSHLDEVIIAGREKGYCWTSEYYTWSAPLPGWGDYYSWMAETP